MDMEIGQAVIFTDNSSGKNATGVTYEWDFGDGSPLSTNEPVTHKYNTSGTYNVTHSVKNSCNINPVTCVAQVTVLQQNICNWIKLSGGMTSMTVPFVFNLVDAYLGFTNIDFTPTIPHIMGCVDYYLGFISSGNAQTGCVY